MKWNFRRLDPDQGGGGIFPANYTRAAPPRDCEDRSLEQIIDCLKPADFTTRPLQHDESDLRSCELKHAIVERINGLIKARGLTQRQAAAELGLSQPKVSDLRNGKLHGTSVEKMLAIMLRLGQHVEIHFMTAHADEMPRLAVRGGRPRPS